MRHFFALNLKLKRGLLLRTHVKRYSNGFQNVAVFISQAASTHNHPTRFAVWQKKAMLGLKRADEGTGTIVLVLHRASFIGVNPRKNQLTGQRQVGVEAVNPASLIAHP